MMNDDIYYYKKRIREEWSLTLSQDDPHRTGIQFARRARLARVVGLAAMFFPVAEIHLAALCLAVILPRRFTSSAGNF